MTKGPVGLGWIVRDEIIRWIEATFGPEGM